MPDQNHRPDPAYMRLPVSEREVRIEKLQQMMASCTLCPRQCRVDRLNGEIGKCEAPAEALITSAGPHFGEESVLVGPGGSGTIFFIHCNLGCVYCQNWTISRGIDPGRQVNSEELARVMLHLQNRGCSNINLVTPTPYLSGIAEAVNLAAEKGLHLPVVYNCGGYESVEILHLLEGFIDIYMPDAKYGSDASGEIYSGVSDYYTRLRDALKEMQDQVGDLAVGPDNLAYRGLLVRHLVLPEDLAGSETIARFLSEEVSPHCAVNVMAQYYPAHRSGEFPALNRRITTDEFLTAREAFRKAGLRLL